MTPCQGRSREVKILAQIGQGATIAYGLSPSAYAQISRPVQNLSAGHSQVAKWRYFYGYLTVDWSVQKG
jgi:hypothetical protein